jgi:GrpB protein
MPDLSAPRSALSVAAARADTELRLCCPHRPIRVSGRCTALCRLPGVIVVAEYDPAWPQRFERLRREYTGAMAAAGVPVVAIEHVGSTSVLGLAAKPVIDCEIVVAGQDVAAASQALTRLGSNRSASSASRCGGHSRSQSGWPGPTPMSWWRVVCRCAITWLSGAFCGPTLSCGSSMRR